MRHAFLPETGFGMFSDEGNELVDIAIKAVVETMPGDGGDEHLWAILARVQKIVARAGHSEVFDTVVSECILGTLENPDF